MRNAEHQDTADGGQADLAGAVRTAVDLGQPPHCLSRDATAGHGLTSHASHLGLPLEP